MSSLTDREAEHHLFCTCWSIVRAILTSTSTSAYPCLASESQTTLFPCCVVWDSEANPCLALAQHEYMAAIKLARHYSVPRFSNALRYVCGHVLDPLWRSSVRCGFDGISLKRHDSLCEIVWHALLVDIRIARSEQRCQRIDQEMFTTYTTYTYTHTY